jgi:hypothetical protein
MGGFLTINLACQPVNPHFLCPWGRNRKCKLATIFFQNKTFYYRDGINQKSLGYENWSSYSSKIDLGGWRQSANSCRSVNIGIWQVWVVNRSFKETAHPSRTFRCGYPNNHEDASITPENERYCAGGGRARSIKLLEI